MRKILETFGEPISRGGQESFVMSVLMHMDLSDLHVDLFTPYYCDNDNYRKFIESHGGKIIVGNMKFKIGGARREIIPVFNEYLKKEHYDVVHIHSGSTAVLANYSKVAAINGVKKIIVHSHSSGEKENLKHIAVKLYAAYILKKYATDYCACSIEAAKWKFPKSILNKVNIIKNGVDLDQYSFNSEIRRAMRNSLSIDDSTIVIGHVGRFTYEKNQIFLIDVLKDYIDIHGDEKVKMILVGEGEELSNVIHKSEKYGLQNNIIFAGGSDKVCDYLQAFDLFIFPSIYEGLGIAAIEAQAAGLPIIASDTIPQDVNVLGNVIFAKLSDGPMRWANIINTINITSRTIDKSKFINNNLDVNTTSKYVRKLYE